MVRKRLIIKSSGKLFCLVRNKVLWMRLEKIYNGEEEHDFCTRPKCKKCIGFYI